MHKLEKRTKQFIENHQLIQPGDKVAVGISGGPDSLALLSFLNKHQKVLQIEVYGLHLDHMFRGEQAYQDLKFVEAFCQERNIPCLSERIEVKKIMELEKGGLQDTSRKVRYDFFHRGMRKFGASKLALAHHGDDQAETVLMQLTKGSAKRSGMPVKRIFGSGEIIRPFLALQKKTIEEYCKAENLSPRLDPSNRANDYTRNRFRHNVLPFLKRENPKMHEHFQRFSEETAEDEMFLQELTREKMNKVWDKEEDGAQLKIQAFEAVPLPLQRRGIHLILNYLYKGKTAFSFIHIHQVQRLLKANNPSGSLDLPHGLKVRRNYDVCLFNFRINDTPEYALALEQGEKVVCPNGGEFHLVCQQDLSNESEFFILGESAKLPLCIRTRKAGDRISLKGMDGSKKLKDLFIDEKIPRPEREQWPIVTDSEGTLLWVPGLKKSRYEKSDSLGNNLVLVYIKQSSSRGQTNC